MVPSHATSRGRVDDDGSYRDLAQADRITKSILGLSLQVPLITGVALERLAVGRRHILSLEQALPG